MQTNTRTLHHNICTNRRQGKSPTLQCGVIWFWAKAQCSDASSDDTFGCRVPLEGIVVVISSMTGLQVKTLTVLVLVTVPCSVITFLKAFRGAEVTIDTTCCHRLTNLDSISKTFGVDVGWSRWPSFYLLHVTELRPLSVLAVCWQDRCSTIGARGHAVLLDDSLVGVVWRVRWFYKEA
jgi:hypothetical protein